MSKVAAIVIGRNEGARLLACLDSLAALDTVIYVDSGSTDGSAESARDLGVHVVDLDMTQPFTAARARNAGVSALREMGAEVDFVQFVDGDCVMEAGWIDAGRAFLDTHDGVAVASGRLRERFPEASIYNAHCDREWDTPVGEVKACGGIAMMRLAAFEAEGGFDPTLIAGEEPELCVRLRAAGWTVHRIDADMALHDAAMTRFAQFWRRARRAGFAYAEGAHMHGRPPERHFVSEMRRALFWGGVLPLAILVLWASLGPVFTLLFALYPAQILRIALRDGGTRPAFENAALLTVAKFAECLGVIEFYITKSTRKRRKIIEYK
ncbi:glycosyltransferase family 2 protein [Celeribacter sp.]|uniref:glycosyltransferase family 2 protein n=1 Tax=Celeribacter sp. TaxID=1890673 RepID=UPI003A92B087